MPVNLATRELIVQKMDKQFNDDLKMRKDTTVVSKEIISFITGGMKGKGGTEKAEIDTVMGSLPSSSGHPILSGYCLTVMASWYMTI